MMDINKCKHFLKWYESRPNGFGGITVENYCTLYNDACEKYPQCLFRKDEVQQLNNQLQRKEQALDEIASIVQPCCPELYKNCLECDKYSCSFYKIQEILNRIGE